MKPETKSKLDEIERRIAVMDHSANYLCPTLEESCTLVALRNNASWMISEIRRLESHIEHIESSRIEDRARVDKAEAERDQWKKNCDAFMRGYRGRKLVDYNSEKLDDPADYR